MTTATTEGKSKPPQIGTEYSNEYVAELQKQGLSMQQILERVTERDIGGKNQPARRSGWTTPFVWRHALRAEIVAVGPGEVISYDLAGKVLWRLSGMSATPIPMPFAYDGLLYLDDGRGAPLFAVRPGAAGDISLGKEQTSNEYVVWSQATPAIVGERLLVRTETRLYSIRRRSG